jgi:type II secretory ATPase GspE/PulE/Tfp pilus assembly ATPase PilB-like protein|nr:ATPase, T2SS/T4P/T4SS family [Methylorubrum populi]
MRVHYRAQCGPGAAGRPRKNRSFLHVRRALSAPHGLILVTGPTGSGKTTTLYAALKELTGPSRNIVTVEDPIEHHSTGSTSSRSPARSGSTSPARYGRSCAKTPTW